MLINQLNTTQLDFSHVTDYYEILFSNPTISWFINQSFIILYVYVNAQEKRDLRVKK